MAIPTPGTPVTPELGGGVTSAKCLWCKRTSPCPIHHTGCWGITCPGYKRCITCGHVVPATEAKFVNRDGDVTRCKSCGKNCPSPLCMGKLAGGAIPYVGKDAHTVEPYPGLIGILDRFSRSLIVDEPRPWNPLLPPSTADIVEEIAQWLGENGELAAEVRRRWGRAR